jgi:coenzyme F420 hydrogenase subunit beta
MIRRIKNLKDVVDWGLCTGCGVCSSACSRGGITLVNVEGVGIRPRFDSPDCVECTMCLSVCPGYEVDAALAVGTGSIVTEADHEFGAAIEVWQGFAADPEIRYNASSGGALSALSLYCLEREDMNFVLHTAKDDEKPWQNRTVQSRTRAEILARTGSRYSPASPCDSLQAIEESDGPCVFIGKPCDTEAVFKMRRIRPALDRNLGLVLTFFCAGTPSSSGTLDLVASMNIDAGDIRNLRYRGEGWPGRFKVMHNGGSEKSLSYADSWGSLTRYRPPRCHLCPDGLGRVADISCGDAWDKFDENNDSGRSLIIVRTPLGQEILRRAIVAGYIQAEPTGPAQVFAAQSNLLARRREIFGRLFAMTLLGIPTPRFIGFSLFRSWLRLPLLTKARTVAGTIIRLVRNGRWRRRPVF